VELRRADATDAAALAVLHLRTVLDAFAPFFPPEAPAPDLDEMIDDWARRIGSDAPDGAACFVCDDAAGEPVGVVIAGPDPRDGSRGHVSRLYVDPARWGRGIGRALHDRALEHLRAQGFRDATLWVLERTDRSRGWYERIGWRSTGARVAVYAPGGVDDVGYEIEL
jgi:ribosomal protein S18 acetylase RimI-like enzyme